MLKSCVAAMCLLGVDAGLVQDSYNNHNQAFFTKDVDGLLKDYTEDSTVRIFNQADNSSQIYKGLTEVREAFTTILGIFDDLSGYQGYANDVQENSPHGPGGGWTVGAVPSSGVAFFADFIVADANGKFFRHDTILDYPAHKFKVDQPWGAQGDGAVQASFNNHNQAFFTKDLDGLLTDYTEHSTVRIFNQADNSLKTYQGLDEVRVAFTTILNIFRDLSGYEGHVGDVQENSPQGAGGGWTIGGVSSSGVSFFSDSIEADAKGKFIRHDTILNYKPSAQLII
jgi:hypothetical protein